LGVFARFNGEFGVVSHLLLLDLSVVLLLLLVQLPVARG